MLRNIIENLRYSGPWRIRSRLGVGDVLPKWQTTTWLSTHEFPLCRNGRTVISYPYTQVEKIIYKHDPSLKESIDITFIKNGSVLLESLANRHTSIYIYYIHLVSVTNDQEKMNKYKIQCYLSVSRF